MRYLALLALLLGSTLLSVYPQSRRVPPGGGRQNERPGPSPTPKPKTIEPQDASNTIDSGDIIAVDTSLVTIPVRILDRRNRFIGGLKQENFKVFEDNVEQDIAYFTNESQPFTVALVLDMSYSTTFKIGEIQAAAIAFIDQLRPDDKVMVISFDQDVHMLCEATSERGTIYRAIRSTRVSTGTSLYEAVSLTMNDRMRSIKGRKAIVLFTDGVDTTSIRSNSGANIRDAMEQDVLIYPIRYDTFSDVQSMKNKPRIELPMPGKPVPQPPAIRTGDTKGTTAEEYKEAEDYLNRLADFTGGTLHLASTVGNLNKAFTKIASELREFYSLGYYPKSEGIPGKTRRIKVKIDQPEVAVKARDSYVVPKKKKLRTS